MANLEFKRVLNCLGFVATMIVACALAVTCIFSFVSDSVSFSFFRITDLTSAVMFVANVIAYFITIVSGFYYCLCKRSHAFMIAQIIGTIIILAAIIVGVIS